MPKKPYTFIATLTALNLICFTAASADDRERLDVSPDVQEKLITNMRVQFATLDDILLALGEGDFGTAADIAELRMTMGHTRWEQMLEQGASMADIATERKQFMSLSMQERQKIEKAGIKHGGGLGRFMPDDFRGMGQAYHEVAGNLANVLRAAATPPTAENYRKAFEALEEVTATCNSCHETFRIPRQGE
ncbi:cytochrome c [Candidatus Bathyarchaeota archaeon]|jgi:cytochrome c556|nr:cytochrome c [Candidatus Bathyarchaeota archaeon]